MYASAKFLDTNRYLTIEGDLPILNRGELIVVKTDRGEEAVRFIGYSKEQSEIIASFLRKTDQEDIQKLEKNSRDSQEAFLIFRQKAKELGLDLKPIKSYIPLDGSKVFFYYVSASRVDFRNLVKELAKVFKKRIEMRQIGVRDAAQMLGWIGLCGDVTCCARFMKEFNPVLISDVEEQNLPFSPQKFTGPCGKLICCLSFERCNYDIKRYFPESGKELCYMGDVYSVEGIDPIRNVILLKSSEKSLEVKIEEILHPSFIKKPCACRQISET
ncbi:MAG: regulatory iron-sulfur-containing complex subunit RicT [Aquificaceae bacterium]